jgi:hypothetical protein
MPRRPDDLFGRIATGTAESLEMNWLADRCERSGCGAGGMLAAGAGERVMGDERWRG